MVDTRPNARRDPRNDEPTHPTGRAALLMLGVVVFLVVASAVSLVRW